MSENEMSLEQLERLDANPHYKLSEKQRARLNQLRSGQFKSNPSFRKHPVGVEQHNAREHTDERKEPDNN